MIQTNTLVKAQKITSFKRSLAVVIGINEYQNKIPKLQTARRDAEVLAEILAKEHQYDEVILITDETECKPTLKNLLTLLEERLPKEIQLTKDDRLLFYFAGHGIARDSDKGPAGSLVPQDADLEKNENLLPMQKLHDCLSALSCRHLLVILDCCFAGTIRWSTARLATVIPTVIRKEHYDRFIKSPAWQAITSAAHNQEALDTIYLRDNRGGVNHSPFALALFKALRGEGDVIPSAKNGKSAGDGVISATELYLYLRDNVETASNESQTPGIWTLSKHDRGEYIFLVPGADPKLKPAPKLTEKNNPYRGLQSFEEEHSQLFFGRKELVEELYKKVSHASSSLTVVLGVSGSGKSSLVKAGLIPYLRQHNFREWYILKPMRPSESPFTALARTLLLITNNNEIVVSKQLDDLHFIDEILQQEITDLNQRIDDGDINSEEDEIIRLEEKVKKYERFVDIWKRGTKETKQRLIVDYFDEFNNLCHDKNEQKLLQEAVLNCLNPLSLRLHDPNEFIKIVKIWSEQRPGIRLLLVIDQFEELITLSSQSKEDKQNKQPNLTESQQFLKLLEATLAANLPQLSIVVTLRSDFEPRFLNSEALKSYWTHARFPIRAMRSDELRQAIERPAAEMALYFEQLPGQRNPVDKLVEEVAQMPGALPLLSFTLSELYIKLAKKWEAGESSDRALILDAEFDKEGGVAGSITQRANKEYDELLDDAHKDTMRRVMLRMVTIEGGESARRRVPLSELLYADKHDPSKPDDEENQRVELVRKRLTEARLVVSGQETGEPYVEPAHDFLVKSWDQLQKWQQQEQENLPLQRRLTPAALEWKNKEQPASVLEKAEPVLSWFDKKIDSAEDWFSKIKKDAQEGQREKKGQFLWNGNPYLDVLRKKLKSVDYWFNQVEAEFLQQSVWQRRRNVNLRWSIAIGVTVVSLSLTAWALSNLRQAIIGQMETARESSETQLRTNQLTLDALINSLQAGTSSKNWLLQLKPPDSQLQNQLVATLRRAILLNREQQRWQLPQGEVVQGTIVSQDGKLLIATTTNEGTICVRDLKSESRQKSCEKIPENLWVTHAKFSPDGTKLALMSEQFPGVYLWDWKNNQSHELSKLPGRVESVSFSPNSKELALISDNQDSQGVAYLWNWQNKQLYQLTNIQVDVQGISFKPDGNLFVATTTKNDKQTVSLWNYSFSKFTALGKFKVKFDVDSADISPDGQSLVIMFGGGRTVETPSQLWSVEKDTSKDLVRVRGVSYSPNGQQLAIADYDSSIRLLNKSGDQFQELRGHQGLVSSSSFSPDGKQLLTVGDDNTIRLWNINIEDRRLSRSQELPNPVQTLSFSPDGKQVATLEVGQIHLWSLSPLQHLTEFPRKYNQESKLIFHPQGKQLAIVEPNAEFDTTIHLLNLPSGKESELPGKYNSVDSLNFSPDGTQLAIFEADDPTKSTLHLLDLESKQEKKFDWDKGQIQSAIWKSDTKGERLLVAMGAGTDSNVEIQDFFSRKQLASLPLGRGRVKNITNISFNNEGTSVGISYRRTVLWWDLQSNQYVDLNLSSSETSSDDNKISLKFGEISPDGSAIATIDENGQAKLWQLGGLDELLTHGCQQAHNYLATLDEKNSDRHLCDN